MQHFKGVLRPGQWNELRTFVLNDCKNAASKIKAIERRIELIGNFAVIYELVDSDSGGLRATEKRVGLAIDVTSTIGKLVRAYTSLGGNPFDITPGWIPDSTLISEGVEYQIYPYGGVTAPKSSAWASYGPNDQGHLPNLSYIPSRIGTNQVRWDVAKPVAQRVGWIKKYSSKEIMTRRTRLAEKVIKQLDLKEQLTIQRDEVIQQYVGQYHPDVTYNDNYHGNVRRIVGLVTQLDSDMSAEEYFGQGAYMTLYTDAPEEENTIL
jgi:hypothetical protein